jgi:hypothetical protein
MGAVLLRAMAGRVAQMGFFLAFLCYFVTPGP